MSIRRTIRPHHRDRISWRMNSPIRFRIFPIFLPFRTCPVYSSIYFLSTKCIQVPSFSLLVAQMYPPWSSMIFLTDCHSSTVPSSRTRLVMCMCNTSFLTCLSCRKGETLVSLWLGTQVSSDCAISWGQLKFRTLLVKLNVFKIFFCLGKYIQIDCGTWTFFFLLISLFPQQGRLFQRTNPEFPIIDMPWFNMCRHCSERVRLLKL